MQIEGGIGTGKEIERNNRKRARKADVQIGTIGGGKLGLMMLEGGKTSNGREGKGARVTRKAG